MEELLMKAGLNDLQAHSYIELLEHGELHPPALAKKLSITRSNSYKVLDSLVTLGLASRHDKAKKFVYRPEDPVALSDVLATERNKMLEMEQSVKSAITGLRSRYVQRASQSNVKLFHGADKLTALYEQQVSLGSSIYFIASRADIPTLGYQTMNRVRILAKQYGIERYGIVADNVGGPINPAIDARSNLTRTWMPAEEYTAPVEWSVAADEVTLFIFDDSPSAIRITNAHVAEAFRQLWQMLNTHLRNDPGYANLPKKAARKN